MSRFQVIRGMNFPNLPIFKKENIEGTLEYYPRDGDIIIASYPKTGTTWLQYIVLQITSKGESFPSFDECMDKISPFMEKAGPEVIDRMEGLRIYKHHYRYDMVKKNPKSKILNIHRKPEDTFVSFFRFMESLRQEKLDLDDFFDGFLNGNVEYGSYLEHVLSYVKHEDDENLLLVSYEKLHANPKEGILRIAKFLGEEYYLSLSEDESLLDKIVSTTSFDHMKKNLKLELPSHGPKDASEKSTYTVNFFRKGAVGDGKNLLSPEQLKRLRMKMNEIMKGTEILQEWTQD